MYDAKFVYGNLPVSIMSQSNADLQKTETSVTTTKDNNNNDKTQTEKKKVVALLSGGLDSQLAVRMMQEQGFDVSAVAIKTPFCDFD